MNKKNICLISRSLYPIKIEDHSQNMKTFEGWLRFWDNVVIISQCDSNKLHESQYKNIYGVLLPLASNRYFNVLYFTISGLLNIRRQNKKFNFDLYQASDAGGAILALLASRFYKKKFLFEVQGDIFDYPDKVGGKVHSRLVKFFSELIVKKADYVRIVSPFLLQPLDRFNVPREKVFLVPPRCDSGLFNGNNVSKERLDVFNKSKYNLLFVGNLLIAKGVDILLDAFALIVNECPDICLILVGDGQERSNILAQAKKLNIQNNVVLLGRVDYQMIPSLMHYSDQLILPSIEEGVGRVLLEAMAMRLPIVASNVGGIPLLIDDKKEGLLFEVGDTQALKESVLFLLNNPQFTEEMIDKAYTKFLYNYEYEVSMKMFLQMYKKIFAN